MVKTGRSSFRQPIRRLAELGIALCCGLTWGPPAAAIHDNIVPIFESDVTAGTWGFGLKRVNGPWITSLNSGYAIYPASSIKILQHLATMRLVQFNLLDLDADLVAVCSGTTNCSDAPNATVGSCMAVNQTLRSTLNDMMKASDNEATNAIQELVGATVSVDPMPASSGRAHMNFVAHTLVGMSSSSQLVHKFNCGNVSNNPYNTNTLADFFRLYEAIAADGSLISPATRAELKTMMLDEDNSFFTGSLAPVIDAEAAELGKAAIAADFKSLVRLIYKGGSIGASDPSVPPNYQSRFGLVQLPVDNGGSRRLYTFGSFVDAAQSLQSTTIGDTSTELLRPVIRSALLTWTTPGPSFAAAETGAAAAEVRRIQSTANGRSNTARLAAAGAHLERAAAMLDDPAWEQPGVWGPLTASVEVLEGVRRSAPSADLDAVLNRIGAVALHLATNELARAAGEGLGPRLAAELDRADDLLAGPPRAGTLESLQAMQRAFIAARLARPVRDDCRGANAAPECAAGTGFAPMVDDPSGSDPPIEGDPETEG